jgi:hypothetical protein
LLLKTTRRVTLYSTLHSDGRVAGRGVPRSDVIQQFGNPVATRTFKTPVTVRQARARHIVGSHYYDNLSAVADSARIGRIDEFRIRGPIYSNDYYYMEDGIVRGTLGLADLLFFPFDVFDYVRDQWKVTYLRVFYFPGDTYLYQTYLFELHDRHATPAELQKSL